MGISRRGFIKLGLAAMAGTSLPTACKKDTTGPKTEVPVNYSGSLHGLIYGRNVGSGRIIFERTTALAQLIAKIKYNRAPYHNMTGGVDGYLDNL